MTLCAPVACYSVLLACLILGICGLLHGDFGMLLGTDRHVMTLMGIRPGLFLLKISICLLYIYV